MALNVDDCFGQWTIYDSNQKDVEVARQYLLEGRGQLVSYDYEKLYVAGNLGLFSLDNNNNVFVEHDFHNDCDIATHFMVDDEPIFIPINNTIYESDTSLTTGVSGTDVSGTVIVNPYFEKYGMKVSVVNNGKCVDMNNDFTLVRCALCPCSTRIRFTFTDGGREFFLRYKAYLVEDSIRSQLTTECIASNHCYKDMMIYSLS